MCSKALNLPFPFQLAIACCDWIKSSNPVIADSTHVCILILVRDFWYIRASNSLKKLDSESIESSLWVQWEITWSWVREVLTLDQFMKHSAPVLVPFLGLGILDYETQSNLMVAFPLGGLCWVLYLNFNSFSIAIFLLSYIWNGYHILISNI